MLQALSYKNVRLSQRDTAHLLGLAWEHGFATWHATKCTEDIWEAMRWRTQARIEVLLQTLLIGTCVGSTEKMDGLSAAAVRGIATWHATKCTEDMWEAMR